MIRIGIDLDNTIINYSKAFRKVLIKDRVIFDKRIKSKKKIKNFFHKKKDFKYFTQLQGKVYGNEILEAEIYPGFKKFIRYCIKHKSQIQLEIVSHKTTYPIIGKKINLRKKAIFFLKKNQINLSDFKKISFYQKFEKKTQYINLNNFDIFIDDLEAILKKIKSRKTELILFQGKSKKFNNYSDWFRIKKYINKKLKNEN